MIRRRPLFPEEKPPICPYLLTVGIFGTGIVHYLAPEVEGYMGTIVGIAWVWSLGAEDRFLWPSERVPDLDSGYG